jgi:hypothetical protein
MAAGGGRPAEEPSEPAGKMPLADPLPSKDDAPKKLPESILADSPLVAAVKCLLEKRPDDIRDKLKSLDPAQRDVLMKLLPFTVEVSEGGLASADPHEIAVVVDNLQGLLWALRPRAALVMDKFCFCKQVRNFGKFEPLENNPTFRSGDMVEVYAEIRNVSSQPHQTKQGDFRTHLRSKLEIRDSAGGVIFSWLAGKPDETLTPQHDYFQHYRLRIPEKARPGKYVLNLEAEDVPTGRKIQQKIDFQVSDRE